MGEKILTTKTYAEVWDLDVFFKGGSSSPELREHLNALTGKLDAFEKTLSTFEVPTGESDAAKISSIIEETKQVAENLSQAGAVVGCYLAQDTTDKQANLLQGEIGSLGARFSSSMLVVQQQLSKTEETVWTALMKDEQLKEFAFVLNEWRDEAKELLSEKEEDMITALGVDGYHGWGQLYDLLVGDVKVRVTVDGEEKEFSVGQASNLSSHPDAQVRKESFEAS